MAVKKANAFSMMEIMIAIAIVGVLVSLSVPSWLRAKEVGYVREAGVSLQMILQAYRQYYMDRGAFDVVFTDLVGPSSWMPYDPSVSSDWNYTGVAPTATTVVITATRTGGGPAYNGTTIAIDQDSNAVPSAPAHPLAEYGDF